VISGRTHPLAHPGGPDPDASAWRALALTAAWTADRLSPQVPARGPLDRMLRRHLPPTTAGGPVWEPALDAYGVELFDAAVLLGVALARTWPERAEDVADWAHRALAHAGLPAAPAPAAAEPVLDPAPLGLAP
jgi:hypothetical protein